MPKVSVILTTYNRPEMLRRAVESVLSQTFEDYELIIMDDNSSNEEQLKYLLELEGGFFLGQNRIKVYRAEVQEEERLKSVRYATLINLAMELVAEGDYITYLCDDDFFLPERLEKMVKFLDENPDKHVVYGSQGTVYVQSDGSEVGGALREATAVLDNADCVVDHSSVMHRYGCFDAVGGWDNGPDLWGHADGVFWKKLGEAGYKFYPIKEMLDVHVYHDGSWTKKLGELSQPK